MGADSEPSPESVTAAAPGVADVRIGFGQQDPPAGGYTLTGFDDRLATMAEQQETLVGAGDYRAVFHLTYLTFSRRVRAALAAGRFADADWAADMSCRFVDAYLEQVRRWGRGDPTQCRAWRVAFGSAQSGRANVVQAMLLGMNAHIHYDLAFVTLGACRAAGDLSDPSPPRPSISRARVPDARYRDFLLINQVGWESIPHIQETVLRTFARTLAWGTKPVARLTRTLGQRLLMEARDTSWAHTSLLVHAPTETDRAAVAAMIDAHAASHTHLVAALTANPRRAVGGSRGWRDRQTDLPESARDQLLAMATTNPVVADLALRQLAFAGADPAVVLDALVDADQEELAGNFAAMVARHAPARRRKDLERYWRRGGRQAHAALTVALAGGYVAAGDLPRRAVARVHDAWQAALDDARRCVAVPEIAATPDLAEALRDYEQRQSDLLARTGRPPRPLHADTAPLPLVHAQTLLAVHPDPWVRVCAAGHGLTADHEGGHAMAQLIEQVLFLKSTAVFLEVDPASLLPVAEELQECTFGAGTAIIRSGDWADGIHLITEGRVRVTQDRDGRRVDVADLGRGDALGELSALNDAPATADCTAVTPVRTVFLATGVLAQLLHQHPRVAIGLVRVLSQRLTTTTLMLADG
ncbi:MAG: DUF5995 family protein [Egibacteraceae bacterium]